jgi:hypothetical protein
MFHMSVLAQDMNDAELCLALLFGPQNTANK